MKNRKRIFYFLLGLVILFTGFVMIGTGDWQEGMRFSTGASESEVTGWLDGLDL